MTVRALAGAQYGEFLVSSLYDSEGHKYVHIDRADPCVLITAEFVDEVADHPSEWAWLDTAGCETFMGAVLHLVGINRTVIYRLTGWEPHRWLYTAQWPD